jgi:hypothetical protein
MHPSTTVRCHKMLTTWSYRQPRSLASSMVSPQGSYSGTPKSRRRVLGPSVVAPSSSSAPALMPVYLGLMVTPGAKTTAKASLLARPWGRLKPEGPCRRT